MKIPKYIFLTFVLFSLFFMGSFHVGSLTIRNISTILLLLVAVFLPSSKVKIDGVIKAFIIYLLVLVFCNIINGEILTGRFIHILLAFLFPCVVTLFALPRFLKDRKDVRFILGIIVCLYLLNVFVTYGQYAGNNMAWRISYIIGFETPDSSSDRFVLGKFLPGMTGDVVNNGYFLATFIPLAAIGIFMEKKLWKVTGYAVLLFSAFCMFFVQQRMAFLCLALFVFFLAFVKREKALIVTAIIAASYVILQGNPLDTIDTGRLNAQTGNEDRMNLFANFFEFVSSSDAVFGGINGYAEKYVGIQHNSFTSAFVLGGLLTFISFVVLFFKALCNLLRTVLSSMRSDSIQCTLAVSCLIYAGYGLTHSSGLQNEGLYFWICYSILISYKKIENELSLK